MLQAQMIEWNQVADALRESAAKLEQAQRIGKIGYVGGTLEIASTPGLGTEIRVCSPVGPKDVA